MYVYGKLSAGILESGAPILNTYRSSTDYKLEFRRALLLAGFQLEYIEDSMESALKESWNPGHQLCYYVTLNSSLTI
jgi:hypothetical protein